MRRHVASYLLLACVLGVLSQESFDPYATNNNNNNNNNNYNRDRQYNSNSNNNDNYNRDRNQSQYDRDRNSGTDNYSRDRNRDYDRDRDRDRYGNDPYNRNQSQYNRNSGDNYSRDRDYDRDRNSQYGDNNNRDRNRDYDRDRDRDRYGQDNYSRERDQYDDRSYGAGRMDDGNCCEEYCYTIDDEPYIKFGDKTAYQFIYGKGSNQHIVPQCKPVQFWSMIRDGTKLPDRMTIQRLRSLNRIHDDIVRNYEEKRSYPTKGRLCQEDYELFKRWRWNDTISDANENGLTAQGADDLRFLARRFQTRLRDLLSTSYSESNYYFQYTADGERIADSYRAFVEGLLTADASRVHANVKSPGDRNNPYSQCSTVQYQSSGQYGGNQNTYGSNYGGGSQGSTYGSGSPGSTYGSGSPGSNYGGDSNYNSGSSQYGSGGSQQGSSGGSQYGSGGSQYGSGGSSQYGSGSNYNSGSNSNSNQYGTGGSSQYGSGSNQYGSGGSQYGSGGSQYGSGGSGSNYGSGSGSNYDNNNYNTNNNYGSQGGFGNNFGGDGGQGLIEYRKFTEKQDYREMVRNVFRRLGFRYSLNESVVHDMYDVCRFEKAWNVNRQSAWCSVFTKEQLKLLEYGEDLKSYYDDGYGNYMNKKRGCIPLKDLHDKFDRTVNGNQGDQKASFQFTDAGTLKLLLTAMGIAEDHSTLTADNYYQQRSRMWRTSDLTPYGGNLAAILYQCDQGEKHRVMLFLNEKPVDYPGCSVGLCSWNTFKNKIENSVRECNYCGSGSLSLPGYVVYAITSAVLLVSVLTKT